MYKEKKLLVLVSLLIFSFGSRRKPHNSRHDAYTGCREALSFLLTVPGRRLQVLMLMAGGGSVGREGTSLSSQCPEGSASQLDLVPVSP